MVLYSDVLYGKKVGVHSLKIKQIKKERSIMSSRVGIPLSLPFVKQE